MSEKSAIEWTHTYHADGTVTPGSTWNPIRGVNARHTCARISPGCDNCYAATMTRRGLMGTAPIDYGTGETPNDPARLDETALLQPLRWKKPRKIFVASMTDLFGTWVPVEWIARIFDVMENNPQHTYIVLTKRPKQMRDYINRRWTGAYQPQFIWCGVTIESDAYTWRANYLRATNAAVRWISAEPLLSGLPSLDLTGIDWLVTGGESGPKARPSHPDWYRDLRDRATAAGVAFFHKQNGAWLDATDTPDGEWPLGTGAESSIFTPDGELLGAGWRDLGSVSADWRERGAAWMVKVGNHRSGRLLDGREHNEFPVAIGGAQP